MKKNVIIYIFNFFLYFYLYIGINSIKIDSNSLKNNIIDINQKIIKNIKNFTTKKNKTLKNKIKNKPNINIDEISIIKSVYSTDGDNNYLYPPENPINGLDFWKSKLIKNGDYADWIIELVNNT